MTNFEVTCELRDGTRISANGDLTGCDGGETQLLCSLESPHSRYFIATKQFDASALEPTTLSGLIAHGIAKASRPSWRKSIAVADIQRAEVVLRVCGEHYCSVTARGYRTFIEDEYGTWMEGSSLRVSLWQLARQMLERDAFSPPDCQSPAQWVSPRIHRADGVEYCVARELPYELRLAFSLSHCLATSPAVIDAPDACHPADMRRFLEMVRASRGYPWVQI